MKMLIANIVMLIFLGTHIAAACEKDSSKIPFYLKRYSELYGESPRKAALAWFEDARMGMFIHWGVWGKYHAAWAMYNHKIPLEEYQKSARTMDGSGFNALEIVKLAEQSGMRYITFVVKHHDGFSLWDTRESSWNSMSYPMHRDFLAELAQACRDNGMPLFIYYSIGIDWVHPYYLPRDLYNVGRPDYKPIPAYYKYRSPQDFEKYREFCKRQLIELSTRYGPVAGFWFDTLGGVLANSEMFEMQEFYDLIHRYQPQALIHFKTGATGTEDVLVGERELKSISMHYGDRTPQDRQIRRLSDAAWDKNFKKKAEIAVASQGTWEWAPGSTCQKVDKLWEMLEEAANNNANLLLNIGLKPDGSIPEDVVANFRLLGERIRAEGYPPLNKTTYLELRLKGVKVDSSEKQKTAR